MTALIADDEPLLRDALARQLAVAWPELDIVAQARNGREAIALFEQWKPHVCFLDVHMPGITGVEAAHHMGERTHLVFVTAFDQYAVQAFAEGALDYLVKPVEATRLDATVARIKARLHASQPALHTDQLLRKLATQLASSAAPAYLRWIRAQVGQQVRLIPVEDIDYLRSDTKYTRIACRGEPVPARDALVTTPLKELAAQLDPALFAQVHRSVIVNLRAVSHVTRGDNDTADIHLKDRPDVLPVSRAYRHLFRAM
ncbi:response regulator transcription factor [Dyella terrae]|uniref:Response regulator transcription factor n=2 Tax=Dyella TaxID=231454 RepID=A0A4R0YW99_9GAMM|nr:response regulator transcription factor [Dyella terrae]TCI13745.1 response regulator transcription factor [Dyella soli]